MQLRQRPYRLLLLAFIITLMASFFIKSESYVDIHIHDTYYVISHGHILMAASVIFLILGALNRLTHKWNYSTGISFYNVVAMIAALSIFMIILFNGDRFFSVVRDKDGYEEWQRRINRAVIFEGVLILIFVATQLIFILNLFLGLKSGAHKKFSDNDRSVGA